MFSGALGSLTRQGCSLPLMVAATLLAVGPNAARSQSLLLSGAPEGGVVALPLGGLTTSLVITATPSPGAGSGIVSFALEYQGKVTATRTSSPPYTVTFSNLAAGKYFIAASLLTAGPTATGDLSFDIGTGTLPPANDNWNQATVITALQTPFAGSNLRATSETHEPVHAGIGAGKSVWWTWTSPSGGAITATTAGSAIDTVLAVYGGPSLEDRVEIGSSDDTGTNAFSQVTFTATAGTKYYFAVDSVARGSEGPVQLSLISGSPPALSMLSPSNGQVFFVALPSQVTNVAASASIVDPSGISHVDYWLDGGPGISRSGELVSPYTIPLENLSPGNYLLTVSALNGKGLITMTHTAFAVISLAPVLVLEGFTSPSRNFQLAVTGFKGPTYTLYGSTNLDVWCGLNTWTNFGGVEKVSDTNAANFPRIFYRAASAL